MAHGFQKFISEVFVNGKFPKIFPLYGIREFFEKPCLACLQANRPIHHKLKYLWNVNE